MIVVTDDKPQVLSGQTLILSDEQKKGIDIIADSLVSSPDQIKALLSKYNIAVSTTPTRQELLTGLFVAFNKDQNAMLDFALSKTGKKIIAGPMAVRSTASTKSNVTDSYTAATVGIMGSLASIFGMFKGPDPTAAITATNAQILALAAQKEADKKRNTTIALFAILGLLLIGGITVIFYYKKNNPSK